MPGVENLHLVCGNKMREGPFWSQRHQDDPVCVMDAAGEIPPSLYGCPAFHGPCLGTRRAEAGRDDRKSVGFENFPLSLGIEHGQQQTVHCPIARTPRCGSATPSECHNHLKQVINAEASATKLARCDQTQNASFSQVFNRYVASAGGFHLSGRGAPATPESTPLPEQWPSSHSIRSSPQNPHLLTPEK
nr:MULTISPECIES: hypothetical protein [unclassified Rhizobium]